MDKYWYLLYIGISTVSDSSIASTDRDLSIETHFNVKTIGVIDSTQASYQKVILPGRNTGIEDSKITTSDIDDHNVTAEEIYALPESNSKSDTNDDEISNTQIQEESTIMASTKTVLMNEGTLILDDQSTIPGTTTIANSHDQCSSGSQSVSETIPIPAQDSGGHIVTAFNDHQNEGSDLVAVDAVDTGLVTGKSSFSAIASSGQQRS